MIQYTLRNLPRSRKHYCHHLQDYELEKDSVLFHLPSWIIHILLALHTWWYFPLHNSLTRLLRRGWKTSSCSFTDHDHRGRMPHVSHHDVSSTSEKCSSRRHCDLWSWSSPPTPTHPPPRTSVCYVLCSCPYLEWFSKSVINNSETSSSRHTS